MSTAKSRARNYLPQITKSGSAVTALPGVLGAATDSRKALTAAVNYVLSELKQLGEYRPDDADPARWHFATQFGIIAAQVPKYRYTPEPDGSGDS